LHQAHSFDVVIDRIRRATRTRTQVELAEVLGIRQSSISDAKRRQSVPADWLIKLYRRLGINPDWLLAGALPVYLRHEEGQVSEAELGVYPDQEGGGMSRSRLVPAFTSGGGFANGRFQGEPATQVSIPEIRWKPTLLLILNQAAGMEPIIRRGALVGVDTEQIRPAAGDVAALHHPLQGVYFRRVFFNPEEDLYILRAEDGNHPEQTLKASEESPPFVGRVAWVWQDV
jgi:phage repressor protein C with HTH and peptisase S24 domain